ncbi:MAG: Gx transporter family protein [Wujia sp.]
MRNENSKTKKNRAEKQMKGNKLTAICGVLIALSLVLSYLESFLPVFTAVPGIKLGLANIVTIISLYRLGIKPTVMISLGRILLAGILFGNPMVIIYSLAGAAFSILVMCVVRVIGFFSVSGVSICGAVAHNLGQLIVAAIVLENANIMYYMAVLAISGTVAGVIIGILSAYIMKNIHF